MARYEVIFGGSVPNKVVAGRRLQPLGGSEDDIQPAGRTFRLIYVRLEAANAREAIAKGEESLREALGDELKSRLIAASAQWLPDEGHNVPNSFSPDDDGV